MTDLDIVRLEHRDDPRIEAYANIRYRDTRPGGLRFVVEGRLMVERLLASEYDAESILIGQGREAEFSFLLTSGLPVYSLPNDEISQLVGYPFHRGMLACGRRRSLMSCESIQFSDDDVPLALVVLGVTEMENLGSIFRSAAALGIRHVVLGPQTIDPFSRRVIRVSMGNVFELTLYEMNDPIKQLSILADRQNLRTIATSLRPQADSLHNFHRDGRKMLLLIGNEAKGLPTEVLSIATDELTIPMQLGTDSLNVAVAAAIFMHSMTSPK